MRTWERLGRLERSVPSRSEPVRCATCGEPRAWALPWQTGNLPRCLDCGGLLLFAGSPARRPPPAVSPMIAALACERCGRRAVTAR